MNPRLRPAPPDLPFPDTRSPPDTDARTPAPTERAWDHCPNCGQRLVAQRSWYRCPRCPYFMSGSDFD